MYAISLSGIGTPISFSKYLHALAVSSNKSPYSLLIFSSIGFASWIPYRYRYMDIFKCAASAFVNSFSFENPTPAIRENAFTSILESLCDSCPECSSIKSTGILCILDPSKCNARYSCSLSFNSGNLIDTISYSFVSMISFFSLSENSTTSLRLSMVEKNTAMVYNVPCTYWTSNAFSISFNLSRK